MSARLPDKALAYRDGGLAWGATNSGKSYNIGKLALARYQSHPGLHLLVGASLRLLLLQIIPELRGHCRRFGIPMGRFNRATNTINIANSTLLVLGLAEAGDEERIRSLHNVRSLWAEEVSKMPEVCYDMAVSRCDPDAPKWATCNPTHPKHWAKQRIDAGRWLHQALWLLDDNPSLTPEERELYAAQFVGVFYARMIEGKWVAPEGLVYPHWRECSCVFDPERPWVLAYDPAPVNTQAAIAIQAQGDHWCAVDEIYTRHGQTLHRGIDALDVIRSRWGRPHAAVLDPAAWDHVHEAIYAMNWRVLGVNKVYPDIIHDLQLLLEQGQLRLNPSTCPNAAAELYSVVYDSETEKYANGQEDHACDALTYVAQHIAALIPLPVKRRATFRDQWEATYLATR